MDVLHCHACFEALNEERIGDSLYCEFCEASAIEDFA